MKSILNGVTVTPGVDLLSPLLAKKHSANVVYYIEQLVARGHKIIPTHLEAYTLMGSHL